MNAFPGTQPTARLLPPRHCPGPPLSGFSERNRMTDTPLSSDSSTFPAEDPTSHHEPPLSMPSLPGNAPMQPPSSAWPAPAGVATSVPDSLRPNTTSPSG